MIHENEERFPLDKMGQGVDNGCVTAPQLPFLQRDLLRALQCLYYVHAISAISDPEYDRLQRAYEEQTGEVFPVGSDRVQDYNEHERRLAVYIAGRIKSRVDGGDV